MSRPGKGVIYTVIFGGYDRLHDPRIRIESYDLVCFTDDRKLKSDSWDVRYVNSIYGDPVLDNRYYKMKPHLLFPQYEKSVYIDGNIKINKDPTQFFESLRDDILVAIPPHPYRDCAYDEVNTCLESNHIAKEEAAYWIGRYQEAGFPKGQGLYENNILFRRHNELYVIELMESWWNSFTKYGKRDQLSLSMSAWQKNIKIEPLRIGPRYSNKYFTLCVHEKYRKKGLISWMLGYLKNSRSIGLFVIWLKQLLSKVEKL